MKRDMDLIRELLLEIEENMSASDYSYEIHEKEGYDFDTVQQHLVLLAEMNMIKCEEVLTHDRNLQIIVLRITNEGHDFLKSVSDPEVWKKTKAGALSAGGFTVELLRDLAKGFVKKQITEKAGVEI